jgi:NADH:ubiquinone oxidoreductase subunit 2 (subunit N)
MLKSIKSVENIFFLESYGFSLIFFNIVIYLISLIMLFFVFFLFNLVSFTNLNNIKIFSSSNFYYMIIIFSLLSLVGMPPLLGFVGKFLMVIFVNLKAQFFLVFLFILLNLLMIYFYIQNFRFLIKKENSINNLNYSKNESQNL